MNTCTGQDEGRNDSDVKQIHLVWIMKLNMQTMRQCQVHVPGSGILPKKRAVRGRGPVQDQHRLHIARPIQLWVRQHDPTVPEKLIHSGKRQPGLERLQHIPHNQSPLTMTQSVPLLALLALSLPTQAQVTHELTNVGTTFSPAVITMNAGDSIHLVLANPHTCTQVDQATWEANGNTSNGGFNYPSGEHTFSLDVPGTYYYVCIPHAGMGMKGQFIVQDGSGIEEATDLSLIQLAPNPARDEVRLIGAERGQTMEVFDAALRKVLVATPGIDGRMDVSSLKGGNYQVTIHDARGQWSKTLPLVIAR